MKIIVFPMANFSGEKFGLNLLTRQQHMAVYRFRIVFEDQEDVVREIEVLGKQSFGELHRNIQEAIGFDNSKDASFYMSDDYWRKGQEITNRKLQQNDDDDDYRVKKKTSAKSMNTSRVADFIDDPHQKIVYEFDPAVKWTLLIELVRILTEEPKSVYPRTVKSSGSAPKQYKQVIAPPIEEEDDEEDEEDKKAREKLFTVEEGYDEDAAAGVSEESDPEEVVAEEGGEEAEGEEQDAEEGGDYGAQEEETF